MPQVPTCVGAGQRTHRHQTGHAFCSPANPCSHHRSNRTQNDYHRTGPTVAPQLLQQPGIGPITAAQVFIAWSHPRRCRNEAAFARLARVAPLEASSGQHTRHRLNRRGDRQLNQAIHTIAISRSRYCPKTRAYIAKRTSEGKTTRETRRCLKRYIARQLYRLLENPPPSSEAPPS